MIPINLSLKRAEAEQLFVIPSQERDGTLISSPINDKVKVLTESCGSGAPAAGGRPARRPCARA